MKLRNVNSLPDTSAADKRTYRVRRGAVALGITALGVLGHSAAEKITAEPTGFDAPTASYTVQPGDTAWEIGKAIERNQDGVPGDDKLLPIVNKIGVEANKDGEQGIQVAEQLQLPANGDARPDVPGYQLDHK